MLGVACVHWIPKGAIPHVPFELGLFFFLVLTGYLITGVLLRDRDRGESTGEPWRAKGLKNFHIRRGLRILAPYYVAIAVAWVCQAPDVKAALPWYLTHLTNIHFALDGWVGYTSHFWSLAVQQQFYLVWPFVIWWVPKRWLIPAMVAFALIAPVSRELGFFPQSTFKIPDLLPGTACDYFGIGGLLALAVHRGMPLDHPWLKRAAWLGFAGFLVCYVRQELGSPIPYVCLFQQSMLSVAMAGLIAAASIGFTGWRGALLDHPAVQHCGKISYSLYIYHNLAPLICGWVFPWVWKPPLTEGYGLLPRVIAVGYLTWQLAWLSWRFVEMPADRLKDRFTSRS